MSNNWILNAHLETYSYFFFLTFLGLISFVWCAVWLLCISESPTDDKHITKEELKYIIDAIGPTDDKKGKLKYVGLIIRNQCCEYLE